MSAYSRKKVRSVWVQLWNRIIEILSNSGRKFGSCAETGIKWEIQSTTLRTDRIWNPRSDEISETAVAYFRFDCLRATERVFVEFCELLLGSKCVTNHPWSWSESRSRVRCTILHFHVNFVRRMISITACRQNEAIARFLLPLLCHPHGSPKDQADPSQLSCVTKNTRETIRTGVVDCWNHQDWRRSQNEDRMVISNENCFIVKWLFKRISADLKHYNFTSPTTPFWSPFNRRDAFLQKSKRTASCAYDTKSISHVWDLSGSSSIDEYDTCLSHAQTRLY